MNDVVPYRVFATYIKDGATKPTTPRWFYQDGSKFRTYGSFGGSIKPEDMIVVEHARNDVEAVDAINFAKFLKARRTS